MKCVDLFSYYYLIIVKWVVVGWERSPHGGEEETYDLWSEATRNIEVWVGE